MNERTELLKGIAVVVAEVERDLKREFEAKIAALQEQVDELHRALVADGVEHEREAVAYPGRDGLPQQHRRAQ
ncbi:hypothetical protein GOD34_18385 [Sinorhizobium medicae]|uniref:hypothetical protein n=1 Tax=Sinorhizobium medicae TaxID=110321 RepID=UPI000FD7AAD9|nr:hypothetical protein [Sinorhizobium medicae]MDX0438927.1 hypothetical protein [Sinorhizobium medicae]MDX0652735.1 hypothetical protein [Sinorhizobium medicae]MDX1156591.1 hypothetical protein [Sinorhizobium medicae]RVJ03264.1 hypothetical protein CN181_25425 [Sinorhizobium medicae]